MSEDEKKPTGDDVDLFRAILGGVSEGPDVRSLVGVQFNTRLRRIIGDQPTVVTIDGRRAYVESWFERAQRLDAMLEAATKGKSK
jgi:hypothetical protein